MGAAPQDTDKRSFRFAQDMVCPRYPEHVAGFLSLTCREAPATRASPSCGRGDGLPTLSRDRQTIPVFAVRRTYP